MYKVQRTFRVYVILPEAANYRFISDQPLCITSRRGPPPQLVGDSPPLHPRSPGNVDEVRENMGHGMYPAW